MVVGDQQVDRAHQHVDVHSATPADHDAPRGAGGLEDVLLTLRVEPDQQGGVVLLEGVDLSQVPPGRYELICPPVKLAGSDGAPCRAILRELN